MKEPILVKENFTLVSISSMLSTARQRGIPGTNSAHLIRRRDFVFTKQPTFSPSNGCPTAQAEGLHSALIVFDPFAAAPSWSTPLLPLPPDLPKRSTTHPHFHLPALVGLSRGLQTFVLKGHLSAIECEICHCQPSKIEPKKAALEMASGAVRGALYGPGLPDVGPAMDACHAPSPLPPLAHR